MSHATDYLHSLFKLEKNKANCQQMADCVSDLGQQQINHFISNGQWDHRELMDEVAHQASELFSKQKAQVSLLIDEVSFRKKGDMSVYASRQYLGCIGKVDNGQVAVAGGLSQEGHFVPIDIRLFMPESWENDDYRRKKCHVPTQECHKPKPEIAQEIIAEAIGKGVAFDYVNFDALYGNATSLLGFLVGNQTSFIGDISSNFEVCFGHDKHEKCSVGKYLDNLLETDFEQVTIRESSKGPLQAKFHYAKIQLWADGKWLSLLLLISKYPDGEVKFSLSNMEDCHLQELAERQSQRVFVEQMFKECKNQVGMGDYQVRGWHGFHKHMAVCMMAMLLIAQIKVEHNTVKFTAETIRKIINTAIKSKMENPNTAMEVILMQHNRYIRQLERDRIRYHKT